MKNADIEVGIFHFAGAKIAVHTTKMRGNNSARV